MSTIVIIDGDDFEIPDVGETNYGDQVSGAIIRLAESTLQLTGGNFTLDTADVDFGAAFGLKSAYYSTRTANPATAGVVRFARTDTIGWRNQGNSANLALGPDSNNILTYDGKEVVFIVGAASEGETLRYESGAWVPFAGGAGAITEITADDGLDGGGISGTISLAVDSTVIRTTGNQNLAGVKTFTGSGLFAGATLSASSPWLSYSDTDASTDEKNWVWGINTNQFRLATSADATPSTIAATAINVQRSGTAVSEIELNATALDFNGNLDAITVTGAGTGNAAVYVTNALPRIALDESDAAADNQVWYIDANQEQFAIAVVNDALDTTTDAFRIDRTGTTVDLVQLLGTEVDLTATTLDFNGNIDVDSTTHDINGTTSVTLTSGSAVVTLTNSDDQVDLTGTLVDINGTTTTIDGTVVAVNGATTTVDGTSITLTGGSAVVTLTGTEADITASTLDFNGNADISGTLTVNNTLSLLSSEFVFGNTSGAIIRMRDTDATTNLQRWRVRTVDGTWLVASEDDSGVQVEAAFTITKAGADGTIGSVQLQGDTLDLNGDLDSDGATHNINGTTSATLVSSSASVAAIASGNEVDLTGTTIDINGNIDADGTTLDINGTTSVTLTSGSAVVTLTNSDDQVDLTGTIVDINGTTTTVDGTTVTLTGGSAVVTLSGTEADITATTLDFNGNADISGTLGVGGVATFSAAPIISVAAPQLHFQETGVTANNTRWSWTVDGEQLTGRLWNDAVDSQTPWITVERTANTCDEIQLDATTFDMNGNLDVDSTTHDINGTTSVTLTSGSAVVTLTNSDDQVDLTGTIVDINGTTTTVDGTSVTLTGGSAVVTLTSTEADITATTLDFNGNMDVSGTSVIGGVATFSSNLRGANEAAGDPTYSFTNDTDSGMFLNADGQVGIATAGTMRFMVSSAEIDLTATAIDINGTADVSGTLTCGGNTVWHAGNDGAGSGLDADTVDGLNVSISEAANTIPRRDASGFLDTRVIRNTQSSADGMYIGYGNASSGDTRLYGGGNTATPVIISNGGALTAPGDVSGNSDIRLKTNITVIDNALEKVCAIRGVTFDRIDIPGRHAGVIAQEIQAVLPEVVHEDKEGILSVAYGNVVGLLIEAIKELRAEVKALKEAR